MREIWKYSFNVVDAFYLSLPIDAEVLTVGMQGNQPCIWVKVIPNNALESRRFFVVGTGHLLPEAGYVGTFQVPPFVWHLFQS